MARGYVLAGALTALSFATLSNRAVLPRPGPIAQQPPPAQFYQDRLFRFGSVAPKTAADIPKTTFADVAGLDEAKREVAEFVDFLKEPKKFQDLGAEIPKGALLVGPPGTGKTLLAKAVAGEANVPFYSMSGSDFMELFVGVGPSRIRDLFQKARKNAPAIVFIDEIDAIGRSRSSANAISGSGSDERESTLNALLVELDGFSSKSGVVVLAGTNRGDVLDSALTRPGRFDRRISLAKPSASERKEIFDIHLKPIRLNPSQCPSEVAKRLAALTPGLSGAEIKSVCNEAAIIAARRNARSVGLGDFEASVERLIGGLRHTGEVLTPEMKYQVALHEAGHSIVSWYSEGTDPVLKVSIVPRASGSLGYTQVMPKSQLLANKESVLNEIAVLLGGRASEYLFSDSISTGASDDLEKATAIAYTCVAQLGFDEEIGLRSVPKSQYRYISAELAKKIDECVKKILDEQWEKAVSLLRNKEADVKAVANVLVEKEVVSFADLKELLGAPPRGVHSGIREFVEALPTRPELGS